MLTQTVPALRPRESVFTTAISAWTVHSSLAHIPHNAPSDIRNVTRPNAAHPWPTRQQPGRTRSCWRAPVPAHTKIHWKQTKKTSPRIVSVHIPTNCTAHKAGDCLQMSHATAAPRHSRTHLVKGLVLQNDLHRPEDLLHGDLHVVLWVPTPDSISETPATPTCWLSLVCTQQCPQWHGSTLTSANTVGSMK
jgi:hypothetical protein